MIDLKKHEEDIVNFGAFGYDAERVSSILQLPHSEVCKLMSDKKSEFYLLYDKGRIMAEYVIDQKLYEMAKAGDIKALEKLELRKKIRDKK